MVKKIILIFLTLIFTLPVSHAYEAHLQKGALIKVYSRTPLSTDSLEEGSIVNFIAQSDLWVLEQKAIEKGDIFWGYVNLLKMPVLGVNGAMGIKIKKIVKTNGQEKDLQGTVIFPNGSETLGGTLTSPASYNTTLHLRRVYGNYFGASQQYVPSGEYQFGSHVGITSRDGVLIRLDDDYYI